MNIGSTIAATQKTLITLYFTEADAKKIVDRLNIMHPRYRFNYEYEEYAYKVYCISNKKDVVELKRELLVFLLDRMTYDLL